MHDLMGVLLLCLHLREFATVQRGKLPKRKTCPAGQGITGHSLLLMVFTASCQKNPSF
jgi:hypothetical protein